MPKYTFICDYHRWLSNSTEPFWGMMSQLKAGMGAHRLCFLSGRRKFNLDSLETDRDELDDRSVTNSEFADKLVAEQQLVIEVDAGEARGCKGLAAAKFLEVDAIDIVVAKDLLALVRFELENELHLCEVNDTTNLRSVYIYIYILYRTKSETLDSLSLTRQM